jgi:hypothetical protein
MRRKVPQSVGACYELIEHNLPRRPWVMLGNGWELYNLRSHLLRVAQWLQQDGVDASRFPKLVLHRRGMAGGSEGHCREARLSRISSASRIARTADAGSWTPPRQPNGFVTNIRL